MVLLRHAAPLGAARDLLLEYSFGGFALSVIELAVS
jgi:hypothetical protein